jgi:hypothetical protein
VNVLCPFVRKPEARVVRRIAENEYGNCAALAAQFYAACNDFRSDSPTLVSR